MSSIRGFSEGWKSRTQIVQSGIVILSLGLLAFLWAPDPLVGHWTAALEKSKFAPGFPALRHQSLECVQHGSGIRCVAIRIPAQRGQSVMEFTAQYNGSEYPVTGSPDVDNVMLRRIGQTVEGTFLKSDRAVFAYRMSPSADGKRLTITSIHPATRQNLRALWSTIVGKRLRVVRTGESGVLEPAPEHHGSCGTTFRKYQGQHRRNSVLSNPPAVVQQGH